MDKPTSLEFNEKQRALLPKLLPFTFPGVPNVECWFTTALYGNISLDFGLAGGADKKRRKDLATLLRFQNWTEMHQVHGDTLLIDPALTPFDAPSNLDADGCATAKARHALISKAADCQQILFAHKSGKYIAALHAGWKGNSINFPGSGLQKFCTAYDIKPEDVMAVRGPSLGPKAAEFTNFEQEWDVSFSPWFDKESRCMDLWSLTRHQLISAGIKAENIFSFDWCTYTFSEILFSFRHGHSGRQGALIFIKE